MAEWYSSTTPFDINQHPKLVHVDRHLNVGHYYQRFTSRALWLHYKNHQFNLPAKKLRLSNSYGWLLKDRMPECIHGHFNESIDGYNLFDIYPEARQFITFLRDPLDQFLSLLSYNIEQSKIGRYWHGNTSVVREINETKLNQEVTDGHFYLYNFLPWKLTSGNYKEVFKNNFVHVGTVQDFQGSIDLLASRLGFDRIGVQTVNESKSSRLFKSLLTTESIQSFRRRNKLAYEIYSYIEKVEFTQH